MNNGIRIINTVSMDDFKYAMMNNGSNPEAASVVASIGVNMFSINRFRDAGYDRHLKRIWILTRSGSKNHFGVRNDELKQNPYYERSADERTDDTYEYFIFEAPSKQFKHVPLPDLGRLLQEAQRRLEKGFLNEYEIRYGKELFGFLEGD